MASAPPPPAAVKITGAVTADTQLSWKSGEGSPAALSRVRWRDTTEAQWSHSRDAAQAGSESLTLRNVAIDDFAFGVASVSAEGFESPVVFPGAAGAF